MNKRGELIVAATIDPVETGQQFNRIPPHMTVIGWFSFPENRRKFLDHTLQHLFGDQPVFQEVVGGNKAFYGPDADIEVTELKHVETGPWFALHALIKSLGQFPDDDEYVDVFSPHVSARDGRTVKKDEPIAFPTVALFKRQPDSTRIVERAYQLKKSEENND